MQAKGTPVERKYALTKIAPGDWLLPGNDGESMYRLVTYDDGPSNGLDIPKDRTFWAVHRWADHIDPDAIIDLQRWSMWELVVGSLDTRRDAIEYVVRESAPSRLTAPSAQEDHRG